MNCKKDNRDKKQGLGFLDYTAGAGKRLALPWTGLAGLRLTAMKLYEVYGSVENQLALARQMEERFGADFTGIMDDGIILSETLGMKIKVYDYDFPAVQEHGVKTREALSRLKMPDPLSGGRIKTNIQSVEALAKISEKPMAISIEGPFTLAAQLAGVEDLARAIIADPDFVKLLLDFTAGAVKRYAQAVSRAGADLVSIAEPTSIILSPQQFKTFVVPGLQRVFRDLTAWKVLHICGDTSHLLDLILSCGMEGLSLDQVMDIPAVMKKIPENIVVFGNIDPLEVMLEMDSAGVARKTADLLRAVESYPNFIMSTGCDCVLETPFENLETLVRTTHGYPLARPGGLVGRIRQAVIAYRRDECRTLCRTALASGLDPVLVMGNGLASGMEEVGTLFSSDIYFIPELLMCADTLYAGLAELKPHMRFDGVRVRARLMIGVIEGDIHEIGKNLVIAMFTAAGWEVIDLGTDVGVQGFAEAYRKNKPDLVGISALMTTSIRGIPGVIRALRQIDPGAKILVGGAPVTREKARFFGADGYAADAVEAVREGVKLMEAKAGEISRVSV
jgi:uroporphyrinogen decarboxylase